MAFDSLEPKDQENERLYQTFLGNNNGQYPQSSPMNNDIVESSGNFLDNDNDDEDDPFTFSRN